ncbi:M28 family peptidase [Bosea psychrotolerans]|uniref:PA domain-containing protein n=1 Tax=Bosea psychrotolerans TaxID=1871628 RepID=A0A2S4MDE9_9HYPH|nr:M28 family peptidase [Bosea psychrotolerans]POR52681.1 PA domain-containing protein [Bosea psychrotolerans]
MPFHADVKDEDAITMALATQTEGDLEPVLVDKVSAAGMMTGLKALAQWSKVAGTAGEASSFAWLEERLDQLGLKTELMAHDAYISIPGPARLVVGGRSVTAITHSMSLSSPAGGLTGALVDLGEGARTAFAERDLRGRIALVNGIASPGIALLASQAGAAGVVQISPHHLLHEMCISPIWGNPSVDTRSALPNVVVLTISNAEGEALRNALKAGAVEVTLHADVDTGWRKTPLLVGDLPLADDPQGPFILLSCHVDTWFNGVMDNGSANIAMLEVLRLCLEQRKAWRRGIRICFWSGHSQGRYSGSAWYADHHWAELDARCAAHVNLDSPGAIGANDLTRTGSAGGLFGIAAAAIAEETGQELAGRRKARSADDSFPGIGIPSVFGSLSLQEPSALKMRNDLGWWWHTEHDLLDKIDPALLVRDARIVLRVVLELLTRERLPIDYANQLGDLAGELARLEDQLNGAPRLGQALGKAKTLALALSAFDGMALDASTHDRAVMKLSRILVPLDYTRGDRFVHDPALSLPSWPILDPIRRLVSSAAGDAARFAEVDAVRALNRLTHSLTAASSLLAAASLAKPSNAAASHSSTDLAGA